MIINNGYNPQLNIRPVNPDRNPDVRPDVRQDAGQGQGGAQSPLSSLSGGDTVTGQIMSRSGNEVQISLGRDSVITAKLNTAADLPVGSSVTFTVTSSDSSGVTLAPLLTNTNSSSSLNTALMSAGLEIDARNLTMVSSMMERGMSIGKEELLKMTMTLSGIPDTDVPDGVMLRSLGIEPTADNIQQFHAYQGYEHQVNTAVNDIMQMVPETIGSMISEGDVSGAIDMTRDILDIFTGQGAMEPMSESELALSGMEAPVNMILNGSELTELADLLTENGIDPGFAEAMASGEISLNDVMFVIDDIVNNIADPRTAAAETPTPEQEGAAVINGENAQQTQGSSETPARPDAPEVVLNGTNAAELTEEKPAEAAASPTGSAGLDFLAALKAGSPESDTIDKALHTAEDVNRHAATAGVLKLIQSRPMAKILQNAVDNQWKLTPGQVGEDRQVSDLYRRMTEQTTRLLSALNSKSGNETQLAQNVNELARNMNFMNELNNMFNYVQLPMKFSGNDAHGELYVYSNKKHMASSDGSISALLHLDMDNLGPTDVYVKMNEAGHVNTHFYLPDDEALDLIAAHIDELNARLEKRGYPCTTELSMRDEMTNVMEEILEDNKSAVPVSMSNFDARA